MHKTLTPNQKSNTTQLIKAMQDGPGEQTLRNIFAYSRSLQVVQTKMTGAVNVVMN